MPTFLLVQYVPEVLDGWLIVVYLRWLGVDWWALGKAFFSSIKVTSGKIVAMAVGITYVLVAGIDRS